MNAPEHTCTPPVAGRKGVLYLIPSKIAVSETNKVLPSYNLEVIRKLHLFFVENIRSARRFIADLKLNVDIAGITFEILDKGTNTGTLRKMIGRLENGSDAGIISEAGNPGIADPGSKLVAIAHKAGIRVVPLVGPSSILMGLISSGFNGQNFAFNGYLPLKEDERKRKIKELEKRMLREDQTQVFMETPYRNNALMKSLLTVLEPATLLCVASDITGPRQEVRSMPVSRWKKVNFNLDKIPSVFLIYHDKS